jgi:Ulp1 family protease
LVRSPTSLSPPSASAPPTPTKTAEAAFQAILSEASQVDLGRLAPGMWLSDGIINLLLAATEAFVDKRTSVWKTFCFAQLLSAKAAQDDAKVDRVLKKQLFGKRIECLILPIHLGNHWACAFVHTGAAEPKPRISYLDSLGYAAREGDKAMLQIICLELF